MSWVAAAIIGGSVIGAGSGLIGDAMNGGKPQIQDQYTQGPDFQVNQNATNNLYSTLTQMQSEPDYGAIQPDWNDIWNQTQEQVQNYFGGTATTPGVNDQINASFAQRGMSGDPAASYLQAASGANEAQDLGNLSAQQNIAKNQFGLTAQQNWLQDISQFQNNTANQAGNWSGAIVSPTEGQQVASTFGTVGSAAATAGINANNMNTQDAYLQSILNPQATAGYASPTGFSGITMQGGADNAFQ